MLEDIKFQSYCWSLGTTSFRVKDLNFKIERQLQILKELWNENPEINCSNNQKGIFKENTFSIDKVTNNSDCTITFKKTPPKKYTFKIEIPSLITILNGSTSTDVEEGKDAEITMKVQDGYTMSLDCGDILPSSTEDVDSTTKKYIFKGVKSNISCKASAKISE